jgi:hypothetical protein
VTAAEAVIRAQSAGLVLTAVREGLNVRGPKAARAALVPALRPLTDEILALITRPSPCLSGSAACPCCGYAHGVLGPRPACDGCGATDAAVMLAMDDGTRYCAGCLTGRPAVAPPKGTPPRAP